MDARRAVLIALFFLTASPALATDLKSTKTASAQTVQVGDQFTYTIVADNSSTTGHDDHLQPAHPHLRRPVDL